MHGEKWQLDMFCNHNDFGMATEILVYLPDTPLQWLE